MEFLKKFILSKPLITLSVFYFLVRFPNLTLLPIFNDEAIYIDWGLRETHVPGYLYYSLYDAKQPFIMWLFGISQSLISDPLFASRLVSLLLGLISMSGIYLLAKLLFNKKIAILSAISYIVIPIFVLFDRQALVESAMIATSIWSFYWLSKLLLNYEKKKYAFLLGLTLGLGFFSKSTATLFLFTAIIILVLNFFKEKNKVLLKNLGIILGSFFGVIFLLIINPQFWETLPSNSRYVLTLSEFFKFPIALWIQNIWAFLQIGFIFLTPLVFIVAMFSIFHFAKNKQHISLLLWLLIPTLVTLLSVKFASQRYFVCLFPLAAILFSYGILKLGSQFKKARSYLAVFCLFLPFIFSLLQIYNPLSYFILSMKLTTYSESGNIEGQVSGYGVKEIVDYLLEVNKKEPVSITFAENTGNPESGVEDYVALNPTIEHGYFESRYLGSIPPEIQCIKADNNKVMYFVSRNEQLVGFEKYVEKVMMIKKPVGNEKIGLYRFIRNCDKPLVVKRKLQQ